MKPEITCVYKEGVFVHNKYYGYGDGGRAWVKVFSERHATRIANKLNWHTYTSSRRYVDCFYDDIRKHLVLSYGANN